MATKPYKCDIEVQKVTGLIPPVAPSDAANKAYVDSLVSGGGDTLPFWLADETKVCVPLDQNKVPFWLSDETYSPIDLGCP